MVIDPSPKKRDTGWRPRDSQQPKHVLHILALSSLTTARSHCLTDVQIDIAMQRYAQGV